MTRRQEREAEERRASRLYEAFLALGAAVLAGGLLLAFGLVLHATVLSKRDRGGPPPTGVSTVPPAPPRP